MVNGADDVAPPHVLLVGPQADALERELRQRLPAAQDWHLRHQTNPRDLPRGIPHPPPDLIVLLFEHLTDATPAWFEFAKVTWPRAFFVLVTPLPRSALQALFERYGDAPVIAPTVGSVCLAVGREVQALNRGSLRGLALPNLLQVMQWEAKSLAVRVQGGERWGRLHLFQGRLVDAWVHQGPQAGEDAVYEMLSWMNVTLTVERSYRNLRPVIDVPLTHLLMEGLRRQDERQRAPDAPRREPAGDVPAPDAAEPPHAALEALVRGVEGVRAAALLRVGPEAVQVVAQVGEGPAREEAAAGASDVLHALLAGLQGLGAGGAFEDLVITLNDQHHLICPLPREDLAVSVVLSRAHSSVALARRALKTQLAHLVG